jgi:hypothetical protein
MRKSFAVLFGIVVVCALAAVSLEEQKRAEREYVGSKLCRICHNAASKGKMHDIWSKTKHAQAYQTLLTPQAKEAGKKLGISEPEKSGECLRCHATAYALTKEMVTKKVGVEEGVGCESCHGAGKDFAKLDVMKEREKAIAAGLVYLAKNTCTECHNPESPTWNPERYTDKNGNKTGFDFDVLWKMIEHYTPKKEEG